jgi:G3E family GTPase
VSRRLPFTVIGGFLGAGKTTLLNRLLRHAGGRRFAVLVNDFGAIDIDSRLVTAHGGDTISLANGCICCSIGDSLVLALVGVLEKADRIDHVVVEASGVGDPARIAGIAGIEPMLERDGVLVLADATSVRVRAADRYVGDTVCRQLDGADLLILNKTDQVEPADLAATQAWLRDRRPGIRIIPAVHADVPVAALFGMPAIESSTTAPSAGDVPVRRWSCVTHSLVDRAALLAALGALPPSVLRGKGILRLTDAPQQRSILQMVGQHVDVRAGDPWGKAELRSDLVLLGTPEMPDDGALDRHFENALRPAVPGR